MSTPDPMLEALLKATVDSGASDLHLTVGRPATARRDGVLVSFENVAVLTAEEVERIDNVLRVTAAAAIDQFGARSRINSRAEL